MRNFSYAVGALIRAGLVTLTAVGFMTSPLQAAQISTNISGSFGIAENACVLPISVFVGKNCNYSGAVLIPSDLGAIGKEIGPLDSGGFYASAAAAPSFTLSTQTGLADDGTPLTSFLVGVPSSPGDGKVPATFTGLITIDDGGNGFGDTNDTIAGNFTIGPGARLVSAGNSLAGSKKIVEQWTSVTHTLAATTVDSATANVSGGFDYVLGSAGFPDLLCTGTGSGGIGDCFASEKGADSGEFGDGTETLQPWRQEQGGTLLVDPTTSDITRYGVAFTGPGMNVGGNTTAVITDLTCFDTGLDPKEPGSPADTVTDCGDSAVAWGTFGVFPNDAGGTPGDPKLNAGIDNLVLMLSTDAAGNIVSANAYYTMEYSIIQPGDNSYVGGTLSFSSQPVSGCTVVSAIDDSFTFINDGAPRDFDVLANDECKDDPPISIVTLPGDLLPDQGGSATTDGSTVTYTPLGGFAGPESFTYTAQDAGLTGAAEPPAVNQDTGTVTVTLIEDLIPEAVDDEAETLSGQSVLIDVLSNDTLGNPPNTFSIIRQPDNGFIFSQSATSVFYRSNFGFFGADSFDYELIDVNGDTDVATVNVGVFFVSGRVPIDIMPGHEINNINLQAGGRIQVAILSVGEFFDAPATVDPFSLKFGPREANIIGTPSVKDIDRDGDDDLLVKFLIEQTGIPCGVTRTQLIGGTFTGGFIFADDSVNTFHCRRRPISY